MDLGAQSQFSEKIKLLGTVPEDKALRDKHLQKERRNQNQTAFHPKSIQAANLCARFLILARRVCGQDTPVPLPSVFVGPDLPWPSGFMLPGKLGISGTLVHA